jgi:hypothetical protein
MTQQGADDSTPGESNAKLLLYFRGFYCVACVLLEIEALVRPSLRWPSPPNEEREIFDVRVTVNYARQFARLALMARCWFGVRRE